MLIGIHQTCSQCCYGRHHQEDGIGCKRAEETTKHCCYCFYDGHTTNSSCKYTQGSCHTCDHCLKGRRLLHHLCHFRDHFSHFLHHIGDGRCHRGSYCHAHIVGCLSPGILHGGHTFSGGLQGTFIVFQLTGPVFNGKAAIQDVGGQLLCCLLTKDLFYSLAGVTHLHLQCFRHTVTLANGRDGLLEGSRHVISDIRQIGHTLCQAGHDRPHVSTTIRQADQHGQSFLCAIAQLLELCAVAGQIL